jgi:hypothetical protein
VFYSDKAEWRMKRNWIIGLIGLIGIALIFSRSSPVNLCARKDSRAALDRDFISNLSKLGASLMDDYAVMGRQGEATICSVSFVLPPLTKERMLALDDRMPRAPTEAMSYVLTMLVVPNLMIHTATNPGQPLVQRLTYKVNKTIDDHVIVDITDFPGFRR